MLGWMIREGGNLTTKRDRGELLEWYPHIGGGGEELQSSAGAGFPDSLSLAMRRKANHMDTGDKGREDGIAEKREIRTRKFRQFQKRKYEIIIKDHGRVTSQGNTAELPKSWGPMRGYGHDLKLNQSAICVFLQLCSAALVQSGSRQS